MTEQPVRAINIGPRERWRRLTTGVLMLAVGTGITAALILTGLDRWWRIGLFVPFWMGALGVFQTRDQT